VLDASRFYRVPQLQRETNAPRKLIYDDLETSRLQAIRRGRVWLIPGGAAIAWIEALSKEGV
jgi:hypothetical protein